MFKSTLCCASSLRQTTHLIAKGFLFVFVFACLFAVTPDYYEPIFQTGAALSEALPGPEHHRPDLLGPALGLSPALLHHPAPVRPVGSWQL